MTSTPMPNRKFHFHLSLDYDLEAETEEEAFYQVVDLIKADYLVYADEGDLIEVKEDANVAA